MVKRSVLQFGFALLSLLVTAAHAQDVNWNVAITTVTVGTGGQNCLSIATETVNGQSIDLSKGAGLSMEICPWVYHNSSDYGYITIAVPPDQPWDPNNDWYFWLPTLANTQRGTPQPTSNVWVFTEIDTFTYEDDLTFYNVWPQVWNGTLNRTLQLHEQCGRWPCRVYVPYAQCIPQKGCYVRFTDLSDTAVLTGTFPVPVPPQ